MSVLASLAPWQRFAVLVALAAVGALLLHAAVWAALHALRRRAPHRLPLRGHLVVAAERPARWVLVLLALQSVWPALPAEAGDAVGAWGGTALSIGLVGAVAALVLAASRAYQAALRVRLDVGKADNLAERRILTQAGLLHRLLAAGVVVVALGAVFLHFEPLRRIGTGLVASAGIAGVALGFAAQRVLGNVLAGIQIAITQPIRIDDIVVVEGEWSRVEEITLTYVVVRVWDLRRLVLPISYFIERPFQNWTRTTARVIGTAFVYTDYTVPVEAVRAEIGRLVEGSAHFDGDVWRVHVTALTERGVEIRAMMSAATADHSWELRCEVREGVLRWLREHHPEALPRTRVQLPEARDGAPWPNASPASGRPARPAER